MGCVKLHILDKQYKRTELTVSNINKELTLNFCVENTRRVLRFGEVFVEERNNKWNTPYLFNAKELDEETGLYYYGARYLDPRTGVWISVDPLANYNPFEAENFIDGQHNGGIYNSRNHAVYGYCYQNPVRLVDTKGKQAEFSNFMGMSPEQWRSQAIQGEVEKLNVQAAIPAAISVSVSASFFGAGVTGFSISPTWILKGPDQGFHLFASVSLGLNLDKGNGGNIGLMLYKLNGDERKLSAKSFTGISYDFSAGYNGVNANYSILNKNKDDELEGYGLSLSSSRFGPKKLESINTSLGMSKTYTIDIMKVFSEANKNKENKGTDSKPEESTNHYYLRTYTNLPQEWYEDK